MLFRSQIAPSFTYSSYRLHDSQFFFTELSDVAAGQLRNGSLLRQPYNDSFYVGALKVTANLGAVELGSVSSYFHRSEDIWADVTYVTGVVPVSYSDAVMSQFLCQQGIFMQELRLRSADPNARLGWDFGAFYSTTDVRTTQNSAGASLPGGSLTETDRSQQTRLAGFGEVSVRLPKGLTLNAGLHSEHASATKTTESPPILTAGGSDSVILPQFRLSYQAAEHELLYFTAAKGYGTGGTWVVPIACPGETVARIGEDTLWSYEAGVKSGLLDGHLQLDTSLFHMQWNNNGPGYEQNCTTTYLGTPGSAASNGFDVAVQIGRAHV